MNTQEPTDGHLSVASGLRARRGAHPAKRRRLWARGHDATDFKQAQHKAEFLDGLLKTALVWSAPNVAEK